MMSYSTRWAPAVRLRLTVNTATTTTTTTTTTTNNNNSNNHTTTILSVLSRPGQGQISVN